MIKILFITHYTTLFGANRSLVELINGLKEYGYDLRLLSPETGPVTEKLKDSINKFYIIPFNRICEEKIDNKDKLIEQFINQTKSIYELIKDDKIDLIYSNSSVIGTGALISSMLNIPHIWHFRELTEEQYNYKYIFDKEFLKSLYSETEEIIVNSKYLANSLYLKDFSVIYNSVGYKNEIIKQSNDTRNKDQNLLCSVGLLHPTKYHNEAILALSSLHKYFPQMQLVIAGIGSEEAYLRQVARICNVHESVHFVGFVNEPLQLMKQAFLTLVCSRNEAFGRVTIESMSIKTPVVAYEQGGTREIIENYKNGIFYRNNYTDLANKILLLKANPELYSNISEQGYNSVVDNYTNEIYINKINCIIKKALENEIKSKPVTKSLTDNHKQNKIYHSIIEKRKYLKFSIITPSFNQGKYIEQNILSVLNQKYPNFEHIIVDGVSTDETIDILVKYQHLKWISEKDKGQADAINKAFKQANGDIIAWLNTDDLYTESTFNIVNEFFINNPEKNVLQGNSILYNESSSASIPLNHHCYNFDNILQYWDGSTMPTQPSVFFRRSIIENDKLLDESLSYAMDYDLWCRISLKHKFYHLEHIFSIYRLHNKSKSGDLNEWKQFYPEWHSVYCRYKQYSLIIPKNKYLLTVIINFTIQDIERFISSVNLILSSRIQDINLIIFTRNNIYKYNNDFIKSNIKLNIYNIDINNEIDLITLTLEKSDSYLYNFFNIDFDYNVNFFDIMTKEFLSYKQDILSIYETTYSSFVTLKPKTFYSKNYLEKIIGKAMEKKIETQFKISVIIPTYNRSDILKRTLQALSKQTLDPSFYEVIVIDDGSTDNSYYIVNNYSSKYNLKYIKQENTGPGAARNKGIINASSELILIINDDTILAADNLERHLEAHSKYQNEKLSVLGTFDYIKQAQTRPFIYFVQQTSHIFAYNILEPEKRYNYRFFWTCNISIKKQALIDVGLFDENFKDPMMEDTEIGYRLQKMGYQVLFYPFAKSEHYDFTFNIDKYIKRQSMSGRNVVKFLIKHPEMFIIEKEIFGISNLSDKTINILKDNIQSLKNQYEIALKFFYEIDKLQIINPSFIPIGGNHHITANELLNAMNKNISFIHYYNFYSGVIEEANKIKNLENTSTEVVENNAKKQVQIKKSKPKILFFMYGWNEGGGGTTYPRAVALKLAEMDYDISVLYAGLRHQKIKTPYYLEETINNAVKLFGVFNRKYDFLITDNPLLEIEDKDVIKHLEYVLEKCKPDIVHYFNILGLSFNSAKLIKDKGIPSVYTTANYYPIDPKLYMIENQLMNWESSDFFANSSLPKQYPQLKEDFKLRVNQGRRFINEFTNLTLAISERVREIFIDFGGEPNKIEILHQIPEIVTKKVQLQSKAIHNPVRFGFIGSILPHKGVHNIILAAQMIKNNAEFIIYGDGNQQYINQLKSIDRRSKVTFLGSYSQTDLLKIAEDIDVMIIPSVWEECAGLVVLESLYLGIPVIASRIGGIPDFIKNKENGYLYPYNSIRNLAAIIDDLSLNPEKILKLQNNIKIEYTFNDYVNKVLKVYDNILLENQT